MWKTFQQIENVILKIKICSKEPLSLKDLQRSLTDFLTKKIPQNSSKPTKRKLHPSSRLPNEGNLFMVYLFSKHRKHPFFVSA